MLLDRVRVLDGSAPSSDDYSGLQAAQVRLTTVVNASTQIAEAATAGKA